MASDLRVLLIRDCLRGASARRRLCWLVLIMAVLRLREDRDEGAGRAAAEPDAGVPVHMEVAGQARILGLVFG